jgi:hypothetical protein
VVPGDKKLIVPNLTITRSNVEEFAANLKKLGVH